LDRSYAIAYIAPEPFKYVFPWRPFIDPPYWVIPQN
jgi:hypothetical protein